MGNGRIPKFNYFCLCGPYNPKDSRYFPLFGCDSAFFRFLKATKKGNTLQLGGGTTVPMNLPKLPGAEDSAACGRDAGRAAWLSRGGGEGDTCGAGQ